MSKSVYKKSDLRKLYLLRWISIIALGVIASLIVHLVFQLQAAHEFSKYITSVGIWSIVIVSALQGWLIHAICKKFHIKTLTKQPLLHYFKQLKYPSISWLFIFIPLIYVINTGFSNFIDAFVHTCGGMNLSIILFSFSCFSWVKENPISSRQKKNKAQVTVDDLLSDDDMFESWLIDKDPSEVDLLNRDGYINRIANRIQHEEGGTNEHGHSQVLIGDYGSGKSTIIKLVIEKVKDVKEGKWIFSTFSSWGRGDKSHSLIYLLLEQIISDLGKEIEVTSLSILPKNYLAAAYNIHPWFHTLSILNSDQSPEEVLESIDQLLEVNGRELLIVLEDIDRTNSGEGVVNDLFGLFDRIKKLNNVKFIITIGYSSSNDEVSITIPRIVDAREDLSEADVGSILKLFHAYCMSDKFTHGKKIFNENIINNTWSLIDGYKNKSKPMYVYEKLKSILSNPRSLKITLKRTFEAWNKLAGEVNFNDLLIYNAYRHSNLNFNLADSSLDGEEDNKVSAKDDPLVHYLKKGSGDGNYPFHIQGFKYPRYRKIIMEELLPPGVSDTELFVIMSSYFENKLDRTQELAGLIFFDVDIEYRYKNLLPYLDDYYDIKEYQHIYMCNFIKSTTFYDINVKSYAEIVSHSINFFYLDASEDSLNLLFEDVYSIAFEGGLLRLIKNLKMNVNPMGLHKEIYNVSKKIFKEKYKLITVEKDGFYDCKNYIYGDFRCFIEDNEGVAYLKILLESITKNDWISSETCAVILSLIIDEYYNFTKAVRGEGVNIGEADIVNAIENLTIGWEGKDDLLIKISKSNSEILYKTKHWKKVHSVIKCEFLEESDTL